MRKVREAHSFAGGSFCHWVIGCGTGKGKVTAREFNCFEKGFGIPSLSVIVYCINNCTAARCN